MRKLTTAVALALAAFSASSASAMDLGKGFALNTEVVAEHKVDAGTTTLVATPELAYAPLTGLELTAGIELNVWDNSNKFTLDNEFDVKPEILLGATYMLRDDLELEAATSYNFEAQERGEITLTATFNF